MNREKLAPHCSVEISCLVDGSVERVATTWHRVKHSRYNYRPGGGDWETVAWHATRTTAHYSFVIDAGNAFRDQNKPHLLKWHLISYLASVRWKSHPDPGKLHIINRVPAREQHCAQCSPPFPPSHHQLILVGPAAGSLSFRHRCDSVPPRRSSQYPREKRTSVARACLYLILRYL